MRAEKDTVDGQLLWTSTCRIESVSMARRVPIPLPEV
jgi:hypothetical protein